MNERFNGISNRLIKLANEKSRNDITKLFFRKPTWITIRMNEAQSIIRACYQAQIISWRLKSEYHIADELCAHCGLNYISDDPDIAEEGLCDRCADEINNEEIIGYRKGE